MTQPAAEQLLNLADRAERHALTADEAQRLRDGIRGLERLRTQHAASVRLEEATAQRAAEVIDANIALGQRANRAEGERGDLLVKLAAVREDRDRWREQAQTWRTEAQDATQRAEQAEAERDRAEAMVRAAAVRIAELETPNTPTWRTRAERAEAAIERVTSAAAIRAAAHAISDYALTHLGRDLGTIHIEPMAEAGIRAALDEQQEQP